VRLRIVIAFILTTLIVGGCGVSSGDGSNQSSRSGNQKEAESKPDVAAFNDQFTEEFLTSTEPVREGYYPFKSEIGTIIMEFPGDMVVGEKSHQVAEGNRGEMFEISSADMNSKVFTNHLVKYFNFTREIKYTKESMAGSTGEELDFKTIDTGISNQYTEIAEYQDGADEFLATLVWNDNHQEIQVFTNMTCRDDLNEDECRKEQGKAKQSALEILKTIKILPEEE
jgi:hypothetical protein